MTVTEKLEIVLSHATGGRYSKSSYDVDQMICMIDDYIDDCCREAVEEHEAQKKQKPETCRERLAREHPECIKDSASGGCKGCPEDYGYAKHYDNCLTLNDCRECWDRPVEVKE